MGAIFSLIGGLIQLIGRVLFQYYGWVLIVIILSYLIWHNRKKAEWFAKTDFELIRLDATGQIKDSATRTEQLFEALHSIHKPHTNRFIPGQIQEHISLEISAKDGKTHFYMWFPKQHHELITNHIKAQFDDIKITVLEQDYIPKKSEFQFASGWELGMANDPVMPLQTYSHIETDTITPIASILEQANTDKEHMSLQILVRPIGNRWTRRAASVIGTIKTRGVPQQWSGKYYDLPRYVVTNIFRAMWRPPSATSNKNGVLPPVDKSQETQMNMIKNKVDKNGFKTKIRFLYTGHDDIKGDTNLKSLYGAFNQFSNSSNNLKIRKQLDSEDAYDFYRARYLNLTTDIFNTEELASIFHIPEENATTVTEAKESKDTTESASMSTPNKSSAQPVNEPEKSTEQNQKLPTALTSGDASQLSFIGSMQGDGGVKKFGLTREDRSRHLYVIGQSGTGKSFLLKLLAISDIHYGHGVGVVDAHGNFVKHLLNYIPKNRLSDVIYVDPTQKGIGFNPLESIAPELRSQVTSDVVEALGRLFAKGWNDKVEYLLRYCILALAETPQAWLGDVLRLLQDKKYREEVAQNLTDPVVQTFWLKQYDTWAARHGSSAVEPVINRVGEFVNNPRMSELLRPVHNLDFMNVIAKQKILLVNLSRGNIGEENSGAFGALILSQLRRAALAQPTIKPFYLYVDNFQNYATPTFADMLSEARSIGLIITLTNQFVGQMPGNVREAVFGTVGSVISFRLSPDDAQYLLPYFAPNYSAHELINLHDRHFLASISSQGVKLPPFRAATLSLPKPPTDTPA